MYSVSQAHLGRPGAQKIRKSFALRFYIDEGERLSACANQRTEATKRLPAAELLPPLGPSEGLAPLTRAD